jgi:hypothetical protein
VRLTVKGGRFGTWKNSRDSLIGPGVILVKKATTKKKIRPPTGLRSGTFHALLGISAKLRL